MSTRGNDKHENERSRGNNNPGSTAPTDFNTASQKPPYQKTSLQKTYSIAVDDVPYLIKAERFSFNDEQRFYVSVNDGPDHVFTWDSEIKRLRAIDDEAGTLPEALEEEISIRLQGELRG